MDFTFRGKTIKNLFPIEMRIIDKYTAKTLLLFEPNNNPKTMPDFDGHESSINDNEADFDDSYITSYGLSLIPIDDLGKLVIYEVNSIPECNMEASFNMVLPPESESCFYLVSKSIAFLNRHRKDLIFPTKSTFDENVNFGYRYLNIFI